MRLNIYLNPRELASGASVKAAREAFGEKVGRFANCQEGVQVVCTSDQLVQFLMLRDTYGGQNMWQSLRVEVFGSNQTRPRPLLIDVSKQSSRC